MTIKAILDEINLENGSNYKMDVLRKHADNELLQRVLKMAYDKVVFTYGITTKNIPDVIDRSQDWEYDQMPLVIALNMLEKYFVTREWTGNQAIEELTHLCEGVSEDDEYVLRKIVDRDLRINMGRSNINKVFKNLIVKPVYMRCSTFNDKTKQKFDPCESFVQLKADGTYREFTVENSNVTCNSRSGESYDYPKLTEILSTFPDGKYIGELTVMQNGVTLDRSTGNGMINSDEPPHDNIVLDLWDYVTLEEYSNAAKKIKNKTPYKERWAQLLENVNYNPLSGEVKRVRPIENFKVNTFDEALNHCSTWMNAGHEGAILKSANGVFRDGTSQEQLKLKIQMAIEVRITGFVEGRKGTVREKTFGSMAYTTDDEMIQGSCSGFTDAQLKDFNSRRDELIGQVITVECNDITKGRGNDYYALSHPRFIELRNDKDDTDTIESALKVKQMSMGLR